MATEDDKPQTTIATDLHLSLQEMQKEVKELHAIGIPAVSHPLAEMKQVEPDHNGAEGSCEFKNREMNTEPDSSNQKKAECEGSVQEESSIHSIEPTSAHSAEANYFGRGAYFEDGGTEYKFNNTTASFEVDPHETSFQANEVNSSEISSIPDDMKMDSEILHSTVSVVDEITAKGDGSDLSENTSTQTVCQSDCTEETKENAQTDEIQPAGHLMTLAMTDARAGTAGLGVMNYEVKSTDNTIDDGNEDVGISCRYEDLKNEDDKKEKENCDSNTEQLRENPLVDKSMDETMSKNQDSDSFEQLEGKSSTKAEGIQDTNKLSQDMEEIPHNQLEILDTGNLECSISESGSSSPDRPESVREVSDIPSMSKKESQTKEKHGNDTEETAQEKDEVSSEEHNSTSQGSHSMESKSEENLQVKNVFSMCPKEEANCMNDQEIRDNIVAADLEERNRRTTESAKDNSSPQEFQMITIPNTVVDEANNPVLLPVENNGKEASEAEGQEHVSEVDDPAPIEYEDTRGFSTEKKTEDEKSLNPDDTSKACEQLVISQSMEKEHQLSKEDHQYEEATKPFMRPDEPLQSMVDTENSQLFTIAEETEINEEKLQGKPILIEQSNEMQDILLNDHSLEKIGNKHRSREDSSCCSPGEEINQKSKQEDDLKQEGNPGVNPDGTFVGTNNTNSSTKCEEPETSDATESFKIEMPTKEKFVKGPSPVSAAAEIAKFSTGEGKEIGSENNKTTYDDFKQEVEPEVKPNEATNNASQTSKTEEPETIYSTQSLEKQISNEEQVIEGTYQTAEERPSDHLPEDKREKNDIDRETEDKLKPEGETGLSTDEVSDTIDEASNSNKFKEAGTIEAMQSLDKHLLSNDKVGEGHLEIAEQLENYIHAEVGTEKRNVKVTIAADESKPEIHTGQKFEEPEATEATQRINTPMSNEEHVVEGPMQVSVTENVANYCTAEERREERKDIDTTGDDLNLEVKVNEVSANTSNASQSKKFEGTEIYDATQSFKKQSPPADKGFEEAYPVSTAEENSPAEKPEEERDVKDTAMQEELNPELARGLKLDELSLSIHNFQEPEPIDATQTVNKQLQSEEKVIQQADQVSTPEEIVSYHLAGEEEKNVKDTTTADELQPDVDTGVRANETFDATDNASETKSLNQQRREDKVVDRPSKVSTAEAVNYCSAEAVKDEDNVKDATLSQELNPDVDQGENATKASETRENASENTKFEDPDIVDATQSLNQQTTREEKVVDRPPKISTAEEAVNYSCGEEFEEDNVKDATLSHDLNPHVVQEENDTEESEIIEDASESTKFQQPRCIEFTQNFKKDIPQDDEIVEGLHLASTKEETVNAEEVKAESYVKETTARDELKPELDSKAELEVFENIEATHGINRDMESPDDVIEGTRQVSVVENVRNYRPAEERKEDHVNNTTGDKFSTIIKTFQLEETNGTDVAQNLEKDIPRRDKVNKEPSQVSAGEEPADDNPAGGKGRNVNDAATQDESKPEVAPGGKLYEISEDTNGSESTKLQEPEPIDTTQSVNEQKKKEDKVVERSLDALPADKIVNYQLADGVEVKNVNDRTLADENQEAQPKTESGTMADEIFRAHCASENTKFTEAKTVDATNSFQEKMPQQDKVVEGPLRVSTAEQTTNHSPGQEEKQERNINVTTISDELKPELDPGETSPIIDNAEVGKEKRNVKVTTAADVPKPERNIGQKSEESEVTDASQRKNTPMSSEDQVVEGPMQASIIVNYCTAEERKEKGNGIDTNEDDLKPEVDPEGKADEVSATTSNASQSKKLEGTEIFDAAQSFKKQSPPEDKSLEGPYPVSTAEEKINYSPAEKPEEERDVNNTAMQEELNPELASGIKSDELSQSISNFQEPDPVDATQTVNKKRPSKEKIVEQPEQVSTPDEILLNYHLAEDEKKSVKDATTADELQPDVIPGVSANEIFDTIDNPSESTKFEDPETVDATQSSNQQTTREEKVVHGPPKVSTAEEAASYCCGEVQAEDNAKDATLSNDLNPHVVQEENATKESETTEKASTKNFDKDIPHEDKIVEGLHLASTKEETANAEEVKAESYVKETTTRDELKPELDSKAELQVSENMEVTHGINTDTESQDNVIEGTRQVSVVENVGNYRPAEERKEDHVNNTTGGKFSTIMKLEETNGTDVAQNLEEDILRKDKVNEEPSKVSAGEEAADYNPAGGGKGRNVNDAATQDESKPEAAPEVKLYEISEDMNESQSTKLQEPEPIDTTQSVNKETKREHKVVERSPGTLPEDKLVNYHLADGGDVKNVKDRTPADENLEAKPKTESGMMAAEISETHYASESTKLTEAKTVDATDSFQEEMTKEDKVVEGPPKVSTAEQTINNSPGEEEEEERNVNVTKISDKLRPELDPGEISPTIDSASQNTKFKGPEIVDVITSFKKEMPSEDKVVERPPRVPIPGGVVSYSPDEEGKEETNVKETTNRDDLNPEADPKMEEDEISEKTNSTSKTTEFELPQNIEATNGVNTQMPSEDKISERSIQVSIAEVVGSCSKEIKDKSVDNTTGDESPTRIKLEGYRVTDTNESLEKEITSKDKVAKQSFQVSTAKEPVNGIPAEGKEETNVTDAAIQDELQPAVAPGIKPDDASKTMMNASGSIKFQEPEPIDASQSVKGQITGKDKVVEGLHHVSTGDEIVNYHHADEGEEKNVKDKATIDELKLKVESGVRADEVSETHYASESTKFKEADTVDATSSFQEQMPKEDKAVERSPGVSTTEAVIHYSPPEEKEEEKNVKNTTIRDELKGEADSHVTVSEVPETIENASQNTKSLNKEVQIKDKVVEGPPQVSIAEEIVNYIHAEEENTERNANETARKDEQKAGVNPKLGVEEISLTTKSESESTQFEVPERIEATPDVNQKMPSEDKVVEQPSFQVSIAEYVGNYSCAEERNEDKNVADITADKLATVIRLEETEDFKKQIPNRDQVVDAPHEVLTAEELVNFSSAEEGKEESGVMDVSKQAELNPEVAPEIKSNETSETLENASERTKFQEPEMIDATKSSNKQMTCEDRDAEGPDQISTVEGIDNYTLAQQEWNIHDTRTLDELKPEEEPGALFEESDAVHANQSCKIGMSEDKVVKDPPQVSTAEDEVNYSPEEERKEETNVKYTKSSDDLKSEVEPGLIVNNISDVINDASQSAKNCNNEIASEDEAFEGPPRVSTAEKILSYSPIEEGMEESSVKDTSAIDELKTRACPTEKVDEISEPTNNATETTKVEIPEALSPKYDEGVKGSNDQEKIFKYDSEVTARASPKILGEFLSGAEPPKPVRGKIEDYPKSEDFAKEDTNTLESCKDRILTQYSPSESLYEITNATGGLVLEKQESSIDKAVTLLLSGTSRDEESNKLDKEEQCPLITQKESRKEVSSIAKRSSIKDEEKEGKVEGQESLSTWTSVMKLDEEGNIRKSENEDKEFHKQGKNSDSPFTRQESARESQGNINELQCANDSNLVALRVEEESGRERKTSDKCEDMSSYIKSDLIPEVKVMERPIEEILTEAECKEDKAQVDKIAQKDGLADFTQATNNSGDIDMPYKRSIIMSDMVIMAKEDPETGTERKLLTEDKDIPLMQKGQRGETLQPETEDLKPGDASQAVAEAVIAEYGEKEQLNDDGNEETVKFRSSITEENSESELEQEQDDREAQGQQKAINQSRLEVAREEGPFDPVTEMDTNLLLNMQKHEGSPCCDSDKQVEEGDPNDSLIGNKNLPVQEKAIAERFCAGEEDQEPVTCNEDKETEKATERSISEEKTTTSLPNLVEVSKNESSQVSGDFISESKQTIQREEMKDGITGTSEPEEPNTDEDKDEEGEEDKQQRTELGYEHPVIVEASRDIHIKASPKKSHSILSGVGSKVKHSIAKVKKVITGKSSHPKPSSPK